MPTMQAMQYRRYGDPGQIVPAELPRPAARPGQILVRVAASAVNPIDWKLHSGRFRLVMPVKMPSVPGFDIAGEVVEVGAQVSRFHCGDRVYAMLDNRTGGASAEYAAVGESAAARIPGNIEPQQAAAIPLAGLTAVQALRHCAGLAAGQRVLIVGASGGVGHFAVQIAKALGAHVTGVCSTPNVELVQGLGADRVLDYKNQSVFATDLPYDVVFDTVVKTRFKPFLSVMTYRAVYVSTLPNAVLLARSFLLPLYSKRRIKPIIVKPNGEDLQYLSGLVEQGRLQPVIARILPLMELASAHATSQRERTAGKIVIAISG